MNKKHQSSEQNGQEKVKTCNINKLALNLWFSWALYLVITVPIIFLIIYILTIQEVSTVSALQIDSSLETRNTDVILEDKTQDGLTDDDNEKHIHLHHPLKATEPDLNVLTQKDNAKLTSEQQGIETKKINYSTLNSQKVCSLPNEVHIDKKKASKLSFDRWLEAFKIKAYDHGISDNTLNTVFQGAHSIKKVIEQDRRQSEYSMTFSQYLRNSISAKRISTGRKMLNKYKKILKKLETEFGVQPQFLIAFWAMESNFGANMGNFPTINTLATLAHEGRRSDFFQNELMCALLIIEEGFTVAKKMKGSWAGAMGQPQFMPSTLFHYGLDGNADGKLNIWNDRADVFASSANYLNKIGWQEKEIWGMEVKLPKNFDPYLAKFAEEKTINEWDSLGVIKANGKKISINDSLQGSIILPSGIKGAAFLVLNNFRMIRKWNRSINYALAIGHLSDRLIGGKPLLTRGPKGEKALSRKDVMILQSNLKKLGYYSENVDGMVGLKTREAIREYQKTNNVPADAHPSSALIELTQLDVRKKKSALLANESKGEKALSRENIIILQRNLQKLGFYSENVDGMVGLKTREAIREYQKIKNIPADAHPSTVLIGLTQLDVRKKKNVLLVKESKSEKSLSLEDIKILQSNLKKLGFYSENVDGMVGLKTHKAIRNYQKSKKIPSDALPLTTLIELTQKDLRKN